VGAVSYVAACGATAPGPSGVVPAPTDASAPDVVTPTGGNLMAVSPPDSGADANASDSGADTSTSGNLMAPADSGADTSTSGNLMPPGDGGLNGG